jgi:hypothetical protein
MNDSNDLKMKELQWMTSSLPDQLQELNLTAQLKTLPMEITN